MSYISGFVAAVPAARKEDYLKHAKVMADLFREFGATRVVEGWEDNVPDGKITDLRRAVLAEPGELIVFSWVEFPSREVCDKAFDALMNDPRAAAAGDMPFDGKRMIYGGFSKILEA